MDIRERKKFQDMELARKRIAIREKEKSIQGVGKTGDAASPDFQGAGLKDSYSVADVRSSAGDNRGDRESEYSKEYAASKQRIIRSRFDASLNGISGNGRDQQRKQELHKRRSQLKNSGKMNLSTKAKELENMKSLASPMAGLSLLKQIDFMGDMPYALAIMAALGKDILDFTGWDFLGIGTLMGICCGIFIFMMMFLVDAGDKKKTTGKWVKKMLTLMGGVMIDAIPVIDFLPIETATAVVLYIMTLMDRKNVQQ